MAKSKSILTKEDKDQLDALLSGNNDSTSGITPKEGEYLAYLASCVPAGGAIVEIGSHRGKSACYMATGVKRAGTENVKIFCVDLWLSGAGKTFDHYHSQETWNIFQKQTESMGHGLIIPRMMSSAMAVKKRKNPIHLLFIDGGHDLVNVRFDFVNWEKFVPSGGVIAFHDYHTRFKGVDQVIDSMLIPSGKWTNLKTVGRIFSAERK